MRLMIATLIATDDPPCMQVLTTVRVPTGACMRLARFGRMVDRRPRGAIHPSIHPSTLGTLELTHEQRRQRRAERPFWSALESLLRPALESLVQLLWGRSTQQPCRRRRGRRHAPQPRATPLRLASSLEPQWGAHGTPSRRSVTSSCSHRPASAGAHSRRRRDDDDERGQPLVVWRQVWRVQRQGRQVWHVQRQDGRGGYRYGEGLRRRRLA